MRAIQNLTQFVYNHTWLNVLRMIVLRAYFRRDFKTFDQTLIKIQPYDPEFAEFCRLFKSQLLEGSVTFDQWHELLQKVEKKKIHPVVYRKIYSEMVTKSIHDQNADQAMKWLLKKNEKFGFHSADVGLSHGILKLMMKLGRLDEAMAFRHQVVELAEGSSWEDFIELKLLEVTLELEHMQSPSGQPLWKLALERIENSDTSGLIKSYFRKLALVYEEIGRQHMLLMDVRSSHDEQRCLLDIIRHHLVEKKPFSLIRLGDGESYGLNSTSNDSLTQKDRSTRERKWWGLTIPAELRIKLSSGFEETLRESNAVGIPGIFRFIRDAFEAPKGFSIASLKPKTTYRGTQMVLDDIEYKVASKVFDSNVIFLENRCHQVVLTSEKVRELAKHASKVIIVSQYDPVIIKRAFTGLSVDAIQIPKERLGQEALPFRVEEFDAQVTAGSRPGTLVLIAAGFAGKHFLNIAKKQGAVALDAGAMADYWVGFHTRQVVDLV